MLKNKFISKLIALLCAFMLLAAYIPAMADASSDATLKSLWVTSSAVIDFNPDVYEYSVNVPYTQNEDGEWVLVMPDVYAQPNDENASVDTQTDGNKITVTVTAEDATTQDYTITVEGVGDNLYVDGNFESGLKAASDGSALLDGNDNKVWSSVSGSVPALSLVNDAATGSKAMKVVGSNYDGVWIGMLKDGASLEAGKKYYASMQAKLADSATVDTYGDTRQIFNKAPANTTQTRYNDDGTLKASQYLSLKKGEYTKMRMVLIPGSDFNVTNVRHVLLEKGASTTAPDYIVDDYYIGDLVVSDIIVFDESENLAGNVMMPTEGVSETQLYAKALNQHGTTAGLEEEDDFTWRLIGNPQGISISEDGLLTIDATAEEDSTFSVEAVLNVGFSGSVQTKAKGVAKLKVCDVAASELSSIKLDGKNLPGFIPAKKSYDYAIPYNNLTGDDEEDVPEVEVTPKDENADVYIDYPNTVDGGDIVITVTSPVGVESIYTISLSVIGRNLYSNGDFEDGIKGWSSKEATISHTTTNPGKGTGAMLVAGSSASRKWWGDAVLEAGKTYIASNMIRLTEVGSVKLTSNFNGYKGTVQHYTQRGTPKGSGSSEITGDWQTFIAVLENVPSAYSVEHYYKNWSNEPDVVVDEYYIGELIIADMVYTGEQSIIIPDSIDDANTMYLSADMLNQFGNTAGLEDLEITWTTKEDYQGVSIDGNLLTVTGNAYSGTISVVGTASPAGSSQVAVCEAEIILEASETANLRPRADDVTISGTVAENEVLTADYDYYQINQEPEEGSVRQWQFGNSEKGTYTDITGATDLTLTLTPELVKKYDLIGKYIRFMVTPASESGKVGNTAYSNVLLKPTAPVAESIEVKWADDEFGKVYKGSYRFYDANGDKEGATTFRWLISDSENGTPTPIDGETSDTYTIRETDVDKYVIFEVTPVSVETPYGESPYTSAPMLAAAKPTVDDVTINKVSNGVYSVTYKYSHPLNIKEGKSVISWTVDGKDAGNASSVNVPTDEDCTLEVTVTPVAQIYPYEGESKSVEEEIEKSSKKVSVSGGGGGGGLSIVPTPEKKEEPKEETPKEETPNADTPARYWASDAIDFVTAKGFMKNAADGTFDGKAQITRADFIYDVMLTLGVEPVAYKGEFSDVTSDMYYADYLQKAVDMGIISHDTAFNPNRNISRQEVCKILVLAMEIADIEGADLSIYKDASSIGAWAVGYVSKAVKAGILKGVSADEFAPLGNVTREQTAVILQRLYEYKQGGNNK